MKGNQEKDESCSFPCAWQLANIIISKQFKLKWKNEGCFGKPTVGLWNLLCAKENLVNIQNCAKDKMFYSNGIYKMLLLEFQIVICVKKIMLIKS